MVFREVVFFFAMNPKVVVVVVAAVFLLNDCGGFMTRLQLGISWSKLFQPQFHEDVVVLSTLKTNGAKPWNGQNTPRVLEQKISVAPFSIYFPPMVNNH